MEISIEIADEQMISVETPLVLIVDDDRQILNLLVELLKDEYACLTASSGREALALLAQYEVSVVLSDFRMKGMNGVDLLQEVALKSPSTVCIMISGEQAMETAIGALKVGAFDFIRKPFSLSDVSAAVKRAIEKHNTMVEHHSQQERLREIVDGQKEQLEFLRSHDPITGLGNRIFLSQQMASTLAQKESAALILVSIERFNFVRESFGLEAANDLVRKIAARWLNVIPKGATLARIEKDEFGLFLQDVKFSGDAFEITRDLINALKKPIYVGSTDVTVGAVAGISMFPNDGPDASSLERSASIALSEARSAGCNSFRFHKPDMNSSVRRRTAIERNLAKAIQSGEICNYYQPVVDLVTSEIVGMEALVRWNSPEIGPISATEIVSVAEETGLAKPLGLYVLETACRDAYELNGMQKDLKIAVNVSAQQLSDSWFPRAVKGALSASSLRPDQLELEITETSLVQNAAAARGVLDEIRSLGVNISIDDFGTGFSSLSYLRQFPFDTLKIDRSFITDLTTSSKDAEFVYAIASLAHRLGLRTIVEGVETTEQLDLLQGSGCDEWQGFLCSKALPFDEFRALIETPNGATLVPNCESLSLMK
ncbi:MAG TPA: EAL domain-containing protein [Pyrinomonadaceae bacterium]|nr:EAL domain-containing protein [Pyrinomonadaceae bacterium]